LDKVKVPALVTFIIGIINVLLSIALVHYTNLGIYGVALALSLCFAGKNLFFTPIYTAIITNQPKTSFIKETIPGFLMAALLSLGALALSRTYDLASLPRLSVVAVVAALIYGVLSYQIILTQEDRTLLWSLVLRQK